VWGRCEANCLKMTKDEVKQKLVLELLPQLELVHSNPWCPGCFLCRCVLCACDLLIVLQQPVLVLHAP